MSYSSELSLYDDFIQSSMFRKIIQNLGYYSICISEFKGLFGIPDLLIINYEVKDGKPHILQTIAFEMKLSNWKRALIQAYRYKAFAEKSFVVIDKNYLHLVNNNQKEFDLSEIGLISGESKNDFNVYIPAKYSEPYSKPLTEKFHRKVINDFLSTPVFTNSAFDQVFDFPKTLKKYNQANNLYFQS